MNMLPPKVMCDFIARTNWSNMESYYFMDTIIIFDHSYYLNIMITVTFVNHPTLCCAFFFHPTYYPHKSCTIFHTDVYILSIHTEVPNSTSKLNHMKWLAIYQNKPFAFPHGRMNQLCHYCYKGMLTIVQITFCNRCPGLLPLVDERFIMEELVAILIFFCWTWCDKQCCQTQLHLFNREWRFFVWGLFFQRAHCYQNQWSNALNKAANVSKMQTPAITLWFADHSFKEKFYVGFFIKEIWLASQVVFLCKI